MCVCVCVYMCVMQSHACSAVESMAVVAGKSDTWGAKQHEGKGRVVKCLTCGHRWEASDM